MKRSEAIKDIVKKSYSARAKALNEAKGDKKFSPGEDQAPTAPSAAAATSSAPAAGASGASAGGGGGGGNSTNDKVRVIGLRKLKINLKMDDVVLMLPKDLAKGKLTNIISLITRDTDDADAAIIGDDPELIEQDIQRIERVDNVEVEFEDDPFGEGNGEEPVLKEDPGIQHVVLLDEDGSPEILRACDPASGIGCKIKGPEAFNGYVVLSDNPEKDDFRIVFENNEAIYADDGSILR